MSEITNEMWENAMQKLDEIMKCEKQKGEQANAELYWTAHSLMATIAGGTRTEAMYNAIIAL